MVPAVLRGRVPSEAPAAGIASGWTAAGWAAGMVPWADQGAPSSQHLGE